MTVSITIAGNVVSHDASPDEAAGLTEAWTRAMNALPPGDDQPPETPASERPGYVADATAWLQSVIQDHVTRTGEDASSVLGRALASWTGPF